MYMRTFRSPGDDFYTRSLRSPNGSRMPRLPKDMLTRYTKVVFRHAE